MKWVDTISAPFVVSTLVLGTIASLLAAAIWMFGRRKLIANKVAAEKAIADNEMIRDHIVEWLSGIDSNKQLAIAWFTAKMDISRHIILVNYIIGSTTFLLATAGLLMAWYIVRNVTTLKPATAIPALILVGETLYSFVIASKRLSRGTRLSESMFWAQAAFDTYAKDKLGKSFPVSLIKK